MTADTACRHDIEPGHHSSQRRLIFGGDGVALPEDLAACANGGQVVLSEAAWSAVQEQLPGACQVLLSSSITGGVTSQQYAAACHLYLAMEAVSWLS